MVVAALLAVGRRMLLVIVDAVPEPRDDCAGAVRRRMRRNTSVAAAIDALATSSIAASRSFSSSIASMRSALLWCEVCSRRVPKPEKLEARERIASAGEIRATVTAT